MMELKDCPFCGAKPPTVQEVSGEFGERIVCSVLRGGCGASSGYYAIRDARDFWNRRAKEGD